MKRLLLTVLFSSLVAGVSAWVLFPLTSSPALAQQHGTHTPTKGHGKAPTPPPPPVACGAEGQPRCPLQGWMEEHAGPAAESGDAAQLATVLTQIAEMSPDPSWNTGATGWRQISEAAATKARGGDARGARAACKQCHTQWRDRYKTEHRHDAVPTPHAAPATPHTTPATPHTTPAHHTAPQGAAGS